MDGFWFWGRKRPCGAFSHIGTEFQVVGTVFGSSSNEPRVGLFSKSLFLEIVVYLENVFEVGFVPCLCLIWRSKLGQVGCRVNGTLPGQYLMKNSTNEDKGEPLACYGVQQRATACNRQAVATLQRGTLWLGDRRHFLFCLLPTSYGYNFFVRTPFRVNCMEIPLSQEYIHMSVEGNWCPQPC